MATQGEINVIGSTRIAVGLSAITAVTPTAYQFVNQIKIQVAGGSLEIVPFPATLGPGTGATGWGAGYMMGASEIVSFQGPARFYLAATGATTTISMMIGRTAGASYL